MTDDLDRWLGRGTERSADDVWESPAVRAARRRRRIPLWAIPVVLVIPVWAVIYVGGLSESASGEPTQLELGATVYEARCSSCHGTAGQGGPGRKLADGEVVTTFPDLLGHLEFVALGSDGTGEAGTPYGDPARSGGAHTTFSYNQNPMPPFGTSLTDAELLAVVRHERESLSGREIDPSQLGPDGELLWTDGTPMLGPDGTLRAPDGSPLLDSDGHLTVPPDWTSPVAGSP